MEEFRKQCEEIAAEYIQTVSVIDDQMAMGTEENDHDLNMQEIIKVFAQSGQCAVCFNYSIVR